MHVANRSKTSLIAKGPGTGRPQLLADASDLGLKPGEWPDWISIVDDADEGLLFERMGPGTDFDGYQYRTGSDSIRLVVFND